MRYRKRPTVIDAIRFTGDERAVLAFVIELKASLSFTPAGTTLVLETPTGQATLRPGDWLAHQRVNGKDDFWPIAGDVFDATYETVIE